MPIKNRIFSKDFLIILFLGISSGMPLALVYGTLKAFLSEQNYSLEIIGFLSLVMLFYSIKFLFAPFIDSVKIPLLHKKIGHRKSYILITQILLVIFIFLLGNAGQSANLTAIIIFASLVAFASSCQDIAIDGYRIERFEDEKDQALASSLAVFGYRVGLLISGAFALFLADKISWNKVYFFMSLIIASCIFATLTADENAPKNREKSLNFTIWFKNFVIIPLSDFTKRAKWLLILLFIILFKLGDSFASSLAMPFYLELAFSKTEIATIVKTFGFFAVLAGVFFGGVLGRKISLFNGLIIAVTIQALSNLSYLYLASKGHDTNALYIAVFVENFSGGIGDALFVAYLSMLCNIKFSATQFAILSSFASFARGFLASYAGVVAFDFGWNNFFIFSTIISIPALILLLLIGKKQFYKK
jgi:PAT family beta-lactamase induction signal transducer AmpG